MKKRILMLIGALTIISMVFISCSNNKSQTNITDETTAPTIAQTEISSEKAEKSTINASETKSQENTKSKSKSTTAKKKNNKKAEKVDLSTTTTRQTTEKEYLIAQNGTTRVVKTTVYVTTTEKKTTTKKHTTTKKGEISTNSDGSIDLPPEFD